MKDAEIGRKNKLCLETKTLKIFYLFQSQNYRKHSTDLNIKTLKFSLIYNQLRKNFVKTCKFCKNVIYLGTASKFIL